MPPDEHDRVRDPEEAGPTVFKEDPLRTFLRASTREPYSLSGWRLGGKHPLVGQRCFCCRVAFVGGDMLTLVPLGPGDDEEAREKCRNGRWHNAVAIPLHLACVLGEEPEETDEPPAVS